VKIIIAPDSFKGSLSALEVARAIQKGIKNADTTIETVVVPMADGGEGTVQSLVDATDGRIIELNVHDPLFRKIKSFYGIMGDGKTAVIEMAAASGLPLLKPEERNPLKTTSYGTGELIKDAVDRGCNEVILGLGGSATNDGGIGMAKALGIRFLDAHRNEVGSCGGDLVNIETVDVSGIDDRLAHVKFVAACDVDNPLCGKNGAANVYGRQKGATEDDVTFLDNGLAHFADIIEGKQGIDLKDHPGAGAAGGLGFGVMVFLHGRLESGIAIVSRMAKLADKMVGADLVITGEGQIDFQTAHGKTPFGVAQLAKAKHIPVVAVAGSLGDNYQMLYQKGFDAIFSIIDKPMAIEDAFENTSELLQNISESIIRLWTSVKN
jgi:glycerate kinase